VHLGRIVRPSSEFASVNRPRTLLALSLVALLGWHVVAQEYKSGIKWPEPQKVTPAEEPGGPPSDAIVLFDGSDLSAFEGGEKWKVENGYALPLVRDVPLDDFAHVLPPVGSTNSCLPGRSVKPRAANGSRAGRRSGLGSGERMDLLSRPISRARTAPRRVRRGRRSGVSRGRRRSRGRGESTGSRRCGDPGCTSARCSPPGRST
jgi:hypothetical protein